VNATRPLALGLAAVLAPLALGGCLGVETTQEKSAKKARLAKTAITEQKGLSISRANPDIKVQASGIVQDPNGVAAVVHLKNTGKTQAVLPVAITVSDARGKKLYANDVPGLDPSLVSLPVLQAGEEADWVNNQITVAGKAKAVKAEVGAAKSEPAGALPKITLGRPEIGRDADGTFAKGTVVNESKIVQKRLVISCVARRGGEILAAGRGIVDRLAPAAELKKPTTFTVFFIGDPRSARVTCSAPPTVLSGGTGS
jgi:hypothetical protein